MKTILYSLIISLAAIASVNAMQEPLYKIEMYSFDPKAAALQGGRVIQLLSLDVKKAPYPL